MTLTCASKERGRLLTRLIQAAVLLMLSGLCACTHMDLDARQQAHLECLNDPAPLQVLEIKHFRKDMTGHAFFFGLLSPSPPDINQAIEKLIEQYGGNGVINLQVTERVNLFQGFFDILLFPVWTTRTYTIEGDVVRIFPEAERP